MKDTLHEVHIRLKDNDEIHTTMRLEREVWKVVSHRSSVELPSPPKSMYTVLERRRALYAIMKNKMTHAEALEAFGVPDCTIRGDRTLLHSQLTSGTDCLTEADITLLCEDDALDSTLLPFIDQLSFPACGRKRMLPEVETTIAALTFEEADQSGYDGFCLNAMRAYVLEYTASLSKEIRPTDPEEADRLGAFKCSPSWLRKTFVGSSIVPWSP